MYRSRLSTQSSLNHQYSILLFLCIYHSSLSNDSSLNHQDKHRFHYLYSSRLWISHQHLLLNLYCSRLSTEPLQNHQHNYCLLLSPVLFKALNWIIPETSRESSSSPPRVPSLSVKSSLCSSYPTELFKAHNHHWTIKVVVFSSTYTLRISINSSLNHEDQHLLYLYCLMHSTESLNNRHLLLCLYRSRLSTESSLNHQDSHLLNRCGLWFFNKSSLNQQQNRFLLIRLNCSRLSLESSLNHQDNRVLIRVYRSRISIELSLSHQENPLLLLSLYHSRLATVSSLSHHVNRFLLIRLNCSKLSLESSLNHHDNRSLLICMLCSSLLTELSLSQQDNPFLLLCLYHHVLLIKGYQLSTVSSLRHQDNCCLLPRLNCSRLSTKPSLNHQYSCLLVFCLFRLRL